MAETKKPEFVIDTLNVKDYDRGILQLLEQLTTVESEKISFDAWVRRFGLINSDVYVVRHGEEIVATASLFVTRRLIHNLGSVGHIEDVVVDGKCRGHGVGKMLIDHLVNMAIKKGCYKVTLDCSEKNVPFYEKCGFTVKELQMVQYLESPAKL